MAALYGGKVLAALQAAGLSGELFTFPGNHNCQYRHCFRDYWYPLRFRLADMFLFADMNKVYGKAGDIRNADFLSPTEISRVLGFSEIFQRWPETGSLVDHLFMTRPLVSKYKLS